MNKGETDEKEEKVSKKVNKRESGHYRLLHYPSSGGWK
jgi:hypothetical protein